MRRGDLHSDITSALFNPIERKKDKQIKIHLMQYEVQAGNILLCVFRTRESRK